MVAWKRHTMKILSKVANGSCSSVCFILYQNWKKPKLLPVCNEVISETLER